MRSFSLFYINLRSKTAYRAHLDLRNGKLASLRLFQKTLLLFRFSVWHPTGRSTPEDPHRPELLLRSEIALPLNSLFLFPHSFLSLHLIPPPPPPNRTIKWQGGRGKVIALHPTSRKLSCQTFVRMGRGDSFRCGLALRSLFAVE